MENYDRWFYVSFISIRRFLWWTETSLYLSSNIWKLIYWPVLINLKALSCTLLNFLIVLSKKYADWRSVRLGQEVVYVPPSPSQRSIGIMMYLRHCSFRNGEVNGLTPEDLVSRALYHRGPIGSTVISYFVMYD